MPVLCVLFVLCVLLFRRGIVGEVADEMADVALYLLALCNTLDIDLSDAITNKLAKTALKYPIERCRGRYKP